ncbi:hypothetical protein [Flavobacterium sp. 5]|uniref:hypothetical protein n=1 Tax=Flavobacterium sp. 5 TaxID=2035199 RepID=UPI000CA727F1|nr:hypothetical protein [Flavobacterium sp. 5]PKB17744.1 hypothetical protein CLU82_2983 [Flavobacterium sp. 5]
MKKNLLLLMLFFASTVATYSQKSDAEMEAMMNLLGVQKKEAVAKLVAVPEADAVAFWKIYDEYQVENKKTAVERIKLYEKTALSYNDLNTALAESLAMDYFKNRKDQEDTLETYYKKIKKATNATVAFQFYQAEVYILTLVRAQIMQQIPTYGQLIQMNKK